MYLEVSRFDPEIDADGSQQADWFENKGDLPLHGTPITEDKEQSIVADTWREKYRYGDEQSYDDTCRRVISALCESESPEFRDEALHAMMAREIVPAGRILAGAGTDKRVTLINCFVSPDIQDSMRSEVGESGSGIMYALSKAAYTQQMGGGIGMDFSTIRPRGALVKRTQSVSSGVLPFMDMWDAMCATIRSSGARRGAMMATLGIWHPDVEEFIAAKQQKGRLTNFNVSVLVPDDFMQAVKDDALWHLTFSVPPAAAAEPPVADDRGTFGHDGGAAPGRYIYKVLRARDLWDKITQTTYVHAEPGVIFIDRINQLNNLAYCEHIHCVNPCGEQALPANGCCNLGHTNLAVMVDRPFERDAKFRFDKLKSAARTMVRLLDNVLDVTQWPIEEQRAEAMAKRRIGLGFTGLASALQQLDIPYGSRAAVVMTRTIAMTQAIEAYKASCALAKERGPFPLFDADKFCASLFVRRLEEHKVEHGIRQHGIRNGVLLSVAPTGTTSLVMGNVSSGVEPVFAHKYKRRVREASGDMTREYSVYDYGYLKYCERYKLDPEAADAMPRGEKGGLPAGFVTADQLTVEQHLQMAAAAQEWVDSAISKTINCPTSMGIDEFRDVYARAYALGMKGCTTYRPDPRSGRGAVLETAPPAGPTEEEQPRAQAARRAQPDEGTTSEARPPADKLPMLDVVEGRRYRIKWPTEDCSYYVMITDCVDPAGHRRPFELFISTKSERHSEWVKAFSLLVTAIFRREGDPSFVIEQLRSVFSAAGGTWVRVPWAGRPKLAPSLVAAIGLKIEEHMRWLGMITPDDAPLMVADAPSADKTEIMPAAELLDVCVHCGARAVVYSEGCATCHACGKSDCG